MQPVGIQHTPLCRRDGFAAAALALITFFVFLRALDCGFINFDDPYYVTKNEHVTKGLTPEDIRWAFTAVVPFYWHPLTWLSLQLDASLWWPKPRGFLLTNVLLHAANSSLVFLALRSLTGAYWRSAAAALLFAVHPLRVESVAWVTERKDVLSVFFGLLTLWAYAVCARRPSAWRHLAVAGAYAMSLMAKPMLVTLPALLLVLDWWPLGRWSAGRGTWRAAWPLLFEKLPMLSMAAAACAVTIVAHRNTPVPPGLERLTLAGRVENATVSYATYLFLTVWPADLAVYHPHPLCAYNNVDHLPAVKVAGAALLLAAATCGAVALRRRKPYLLAGWAWYLVSLLPVIGLVVQSGNQAYADRFTYFPQIGILLAACWAVADAAGKHARVALGAAATVAAVLALASWDQLAYWRDAPTLWRQSLKVTGPNPTALLNLAETVGDAEAARCYVEALKIDPTCVDAHINLSGVYFRAGRLDAAAAELEKALQLDPNSYSAYCNFATVEAARGKNEPAAELFRKAITLMPDGPDAHAGLGNVLVSQGKVVEAEREMKEALRLSPASVAVHANLGGLLYRERRFDEAAEEEEKALGLDSGLYQAHLQLAMIEMVRGNFTRAVDCYRTALSLQKQSLDARNGLGMALLRRGDAGPALNVLGEAVQMYPQDAVTRLNLGKSLEALGDRAHAAAQFEAATQLNPSLAEAWYDLGRVRALQGQQAEATECLQKAVARDPSSELYRKALEAARSSQGPAGSGSTAAPH